MLELLANMIFKMLLFTEKLVTYESSCRSYEERLVIIKGFTISIALLLMIVIIFMIASIPFSETAIDILSGISIVLVASLIIGILRG